MYKACSILFLILIAGEIVSSQQSYFNNRYSNDPDNWNSAMTIVEIDGSYIAGCATGDSLNYFWNHILLRKIDQTGLVQDEKTYGDTISRCFIGWPGSLRLYSESRILLTGAKQYDEPISVNSGYLMALSTTLDTLWTKEYWGDASLPQDSSIHFNNMDICLNSDLVFTGELYDNELPSKMMLLRTDSIGNTKWVKYFGSVGVNSGYSVVQTSDSGFAIGGYSYEPGVTNSGDPIIIKTDQNGIKQWEKNIGGPYPDNRAMLCIGVDGSIIAGTMYADSVTIYDPYSRIQISKFTNDGTKIWEKKYGDSKVLYNYLLNIRTLTDGSIIICGNRSNNPPHRSGWIMKLTSDGDSLWFRYHDYLTGPNSLNFLRDILPTSDNGYIACGYMYPFSPDTGSNDAWIIKLDSFGCDTPGCQTVNIVEVPDNSDNSLLIYPNPAINEIQIDIRYSILDTRYSIFIYDLFGRKQDEVYIPRNQNQVRINISQIPSGVYIAVLKDENKVLGRGKFIKR